MLGSCPRESVGGGEPARPGPAQPPAGTGGRPGRAARGGCGPPGPGCAWAGFASPLRTLGFLPRLSPKTRVPLPEQR